MAEKQRYAILLDSTVGYKQPSWFKDTKDWVLGKQKQYTEKNVVSGTLLEALSDKEIVVLAQQFDPVLNYKVISTDHPIWLHCEPKQLKSLTVEEVKYLLPVKSCYDRLNEALPKLDWIGSLTVGVNAYLNMPAVITQPVKVTIRYVGSLPPTGEGECSGTFFGVELLECRGRGNTNGWFQDYHLFKCSFNCGLFVSMDKLILNENETQPAKHQPKQQSSVADDRPFKFNDRVKVFDAKGVSEKGTVKWIGKNKQALPSGAYIVGIHTDRVIFDAEARFPHKFSMDHLIKNSKEHTSLFIPVYFVSKIEDQDSSSRVAGQSHKYDTRFPHENRSYNPQDSVSATLAYEAKKHGMSPSMVKEKQKEVLKMVEYKKEEARREQEKVERRFKMQQIKNELQIGKIEGFDDTMLDLKRQAKIMEDLECQKKRNKQGQIDKVDVTYPESQHSVSESQSRVSGYEYHQDPRGLQGITQQGMGQQGRVQQRINQQYISQQGMSQQGMDQQSVGQQGMGQQGMGQQGIYLQGTSQQNTYPPPQDIHSQGMFQQGVHLPQQYMYSQGAYQQGWPHQGAYPQQMPHSQETFQQQPLQQGIHSQGLQPQGMNNSNMPQLDPYQRSTSQNYQSHQYNLSPNNSNWQGENPSYPMERQHSTEFHQILRAEANVPDNNSEPYNMSQLEIGDAVQSGSSPISYGTIKWIGELSGSRGLIVGVEMEKPVPGATDGWHDGYQYFVCERGRGVFLRLAALRRDDRFIDVEGQKEVKNRKFKVASDIMV